MVSTLRSFSATSLTWSALTLHPLVCMCYLRRWDAAAAITVFPFWAWGLAGAGMAALAWGLARRRAAAALCILWVVTILTGADETRPLLRFAREKPLPGTPAEVQGQRPVRVITLNCKVGMWNPPVLQSLTAWQPDIVLLQEAPVIGELQKYAAQVFGPGAHYDGGSHCGLLARGRILNTMTGWQPHSLLSTVEVAPGKFLEVCCVHLQGAETNLRLWSREAFREHRDNRRSRRGELVRALSVQRLISRQHPAIIGGDFNAPAGDAVFDLLRDAGFRDAFAECGSGWPNTYPAAAPMLRIDHLWVNDRIQPARGVVAETKHSDHRMVVCDLLLP